MPIPSFADFYKNKYGENLPGIQPTAQSTGNAEQQQWQTLYQAAPDLKTKNAIASGWSGAHGYELFGQPTVTATQQKQQDATKYKQDVIGLSNNLLDVIANKDKYTPEEYKQTKDSLVSALTIKQKEAANFGASLTGNELALLAGQLPVRQEIGPSAGSYINQLLTGKKPVQTGETVDSDAQIIRKLNILLPGLQGKPVTPEAFGQKQPISQQTQNTDIVNPITRILPDAKDVLNNYLGLPKNILDTAQRLNNTPMTPADRIVQSVVNLTAPEVGLVNEFNQALGEPLKGGDIIGRIVSRASQKPVTTALDVATVLPFLFKGAPPALRDVTTPEQIAALEKMGVKAPEVAPETPNLVQQGIRKVTDMTSGGGSKEYLLRQGRNPAATLPENQVLLEENILSHPTATGKIKATGEAMQKYGMQLENIYRGAPDIQATNLKTALINGLENYPPEEVQKLMPYIERMGKFDLAKGDTQLSQLDIWNAARSIEDKPPKITSKINPSQYYENMAKDAARVMRGYLAEKNPQVTPINQRYSALADYAYNVLRDPQGISAQGGLWRTAAQGAKNGLDAILNAGYTLSNPSKLVRDLRFNATTPGAWRNR